jgi:flagellum-specific ATP synthase
MSLPWSDCIQRVKTMDPVQATGRVEKLVGMIVEVAGLNASIGSQCRIKLTNNSFKTCEVVGFRGPTALVMPYSDMQGLERGQKVSLLAGTPVVPVGDALLGRVLNGMGEPIDDGPLLKNMQHQPIVSAPPAAMTRRRVEERLETGIRSIDSLVTVAKGQRLGIFAGSGVGKSVLLGMLARNARTDVNVVALIGERGREVREFIERDLGPEGLARSVVIVVTSDESAVMRARGAETASAVAEHFRAQGQNVMLMMDSLTRYAMALREVGLASGEPPTTKGYTPSVFAALPKLCERAGWSDRGSITAFYTVLIEGDDIHDPVGDAVRSILDGHIMLSRDLARDNHYPAVDVLGSISRLRTSVVNDDVLDAGAVLGRWMKAYEDNRDLINIGAYVTGSDPLVDQAIAKRDTLRGFLCQKVAERADWSDSIQALREIAEVY